MAKRGRPKKVVEVVQNVEVQGQEGQTVVQTETIVTQPPEPVRFQEKPDAPDAVRIADSRKALEQPLEPGQKFFETPDGEIIIGEADKNHIWSRHMNNGHGGWVNPRR